MANLSAKWVFRALVIALASVLFVIIAMIYIDDRVVPRVEENNVVTIGEAYGFRIGMTKRECFSAIKQRYSKPGYYLRVRWPTDDPVDKTLHPYKNTGLASHEMMFRYSEYRELIIAINTINPPLQLRGRWAIDMPGEIDNPAKLVYTISLTFDDDRLARIQKIRWVFEDA